MSSPMSVSKITFCTAGGIDDGDCASADTLRQANVQGTRIATTWRFIPWPRLRWRLSSLPLNLSPAFVLSFSYEAAAFDRSGRRSFRACVGAPGGARTPIGGIDHDPRSCQASRDDRTIRSHAH